LTVQLVFENIWESWSGRHKKPHVPYAAQYKVIIELCEVLDNIFSIEPLLEDCRSILRKSSVGEPIWSDVNNLEDLIASCEMALVKLAKNDLEKEFHSIEISLIKQIDAVNAHPLTGKLLESIRNRHYDIYAKTFSTIEKLSRNKLALMNLQENLDKMGEITPILKQNVEDSFNEAYWDNRVEKIRNAWNWAQAKQFIEEYLRKEDAISLELRSNQIGEEIKSNIENGAALRAWSICF